MRLASTIDPLLSGRSLDPYFAHFDKVISTANQSIKTLSSARALVAWPTKWLLVVRSNSGM